MGSNTGIFLIFWITALTEILATGTTSRGNISADQHSTAIIQDTTTKAASNNSRIIFSNYTSNKDNKNGLKIADLELEKSIATTGDVKHNQLKMSSKKQSTDSKAKTSEAPVVYTYRLKDEDEGTCILMKVDAMIVFLYKDKLGQKEEGDLFVPPNVDIQGDCSQSDESSFVMKWRRYQLAFKFTKTPGGERWFVSKIWLDFDTSDTAVFKHIMSPSKPDILVRASTSEEDLLFPTPVGDSYKCHREIEVTLKDPAYPQLKAKLLLRELTLQPFIFKNDEFGPEYLCQAVGDGIRSETLPFIFGTLLAVCAILLVAGYAVYRYFKVNKVQYDTME